MDVVNLVVCLWTSPAGLQVSPAESRRYHWMLQTSWYIPGCLQQVSRCLPRNPGGIIGCSECWGMSLDISSRSPGVSSRIQEVSLDVMNHLVCLWMSPASVQASPAESTRYDWMLRTSWYVCGCLQLVSRCRQQNPGHIIGCCEPHGMSLEVSRHLRQNPQHIIGCSEPCGMSLDVSSSSPGASSGIQEVSLDVVNIDICLAKGPVSLQVSPVQSRRYHWMS